MTLSPRYASGRGTHMEIAEAELQTDVMRFLAILSLCLVAIFALVQTIPVVPKSVELPRPAAVLTNSDVAPTRPVPQPVTAAEVPARILARTTTPNIASKPAGKPVESVTAPVQDAALPISEPTARSPIEPESAIPTTAPPQPVGFTLRFEDDRALTRLISRDEVGFFAISADKAMRLKIQGSRMDFWPSSTPGQYHEMDRLTVPAEVQTALLRSGVEFAGDQLWGVTLPPRTAAQLKQFLAGSGGGTLIIGGTGDLRLEQ